MVEPTPIDPQSEAFRTATEGDSWDDDIDQLAADGAIYHYPLQSFSEIQLPEIWEAESWDAGRTRPKTVEEARAALAARIADSSAPDASSEAGAYDDEADL